MAKLSLKFLTDYYSIVSIAFWLEYGGFFFFKCTFALLCASKKENGNWNLKKLRKHKGCWAFVRTDVGWREVRKKKKKKSGLVLLTLSSAMLALQHQLKARAKKHLNYLCFLNQALLQAMKLATSSKRSQNPIQPTVSTSHHIHWNRHHQVGWRKKPFLLPVARWEI